MGKIAAIILTAVLSLCCGFGAGSAYSTHRAELIAKLADTHKTEERTVQTKAAPTGAAAVEFYSISTFHMIDAMNEIREEHELPLLISNQELERCAHIRAKEAAEQFTHYRPDGTPCTSVSELADGEILCYAPHNAAVEDIMNCWMNSKPHREAVLMPYKMEVGFGVYYDHEARTQTWCALFHLV